MTAKKHRDLFPYFLLLLGLLGFVWEYLSTDAPHDGFSADMAIAAFVAFLGVALLLMGNGYAEAAEKNQSAKDQTNNEKSL